MAMHLLSNADGEWDKESSDAPPERQLPSQQLQFRGAVSLGAILLCDWILSYRAQDIFAEIDRRAPSSFRKFAPRTNNVLTAKLPVYSGTVHWMRRDFSFYGAVRTQIGFSHTAQRLKSLRSMRSRSGNRYISVSNSTVAVRLLCPLT